MGSENTGTIARVEPVAPESPILENTQPQQPRQDLKGAVWTIFVSVALPCTPVIVIVAVLLYFVTHYQIDRWDGYQELTPPSNSVATQNVGSMILDLKKTGGPAFYVDRNSTLITTIASTTSKVIPYLTSSIMALVAFFAARCIILKSKKGHDATLLTPEQITLLIDMLSGKSFGPLVDTLVFWKESKQRLLSPLPAVFWSLFTITSLGLMIPAVDTWFGVRTITVNLDIFSKDTATQAFGRQLNRYNSSSSCFNGASNTSNTWAEDSNFWPCNIDVITADNSTVLSLNNPIQALRLEHNVTTSTMLTSFTNGSDQYFFYFDMRANNRLDFRASSPAVSTQCTPMTHKCVNQSSDDSFSCSPGFSGVVGTSFPNTLYTEPSGPTLAQDVKDLGIGFSSTADLDFLPPLTNQSNHSYPSFLVQNPQYFGAWAVGYPDAVSLPFSPLANSPDVILMFPNNVLWLLNCSVIVANATYTFVDGNLQDFNVVNMDDETSTLFTAPFNLFDQNEVIGTSMVNMATLASLASSADELAEIWATEFSKTALSLANGVFIPLDNSLQQDRTVKPVAKVPKIPFFLLIGLKLLYVVVVIVLAVAVYAFTHPAETEVVKAQLSTKGLAAAYFDNPGLLQSNAVKAVKELTSVDPTSGKSEKQGGTTSAVQEVNVNSGGEDPTRVGLLPDAKGVYNYAVVADGVWHGIKPILKVLKNEDVI